MTLGLFLLSALSIWRVSVMVAHDSGPFNVFGMFRGFVYGRSKKIDDYFPPKEEVVLESNIIFETTKPGSFYSGLTCVGCNSTWFSMILSIFISSGVLEWVLISFALSATVIFINVIFERAANYG